MAEKEDKPEGFAIENFLRGIGDLMHQAARLSSDLRRAGKHNEKPMMQSGMTVRNIDGEDISADFFSLKDFASRFKEEAVQKNDTPPGSERRDIAIEVFSDQSGIVAIAEMPGAGIDTVTITVDENMLTITSGASGIDYYGEALLPSAVENSTREQSFRNGVLELRWPVPLPQP